MSIKAPVQKLHTSMEACFRQVREHLATHDTVSASNVLLLGQLQYPAMKHDAETQLLLGRIARARERFKEARGHFRHAIHSDRLRTEAEYELGRVWIEAGRLDLAVETLLKVAQDEQAKIPYRVHAWSGLCVAYTGLERNASAENAIEAAAQFGLVSALLLADEAFRLAARGGVAEAKSQLARALQIDTVCVDAYAMLANLLHIEGRSDDAKEVLKYGLQHAPNALKLFSLAGEICYATGDFLESAASFKRCIELSPQGANADANRLSLARTLYVSGKRPAAIQTLEEMLVAHPRSKLRREARDRLESLKRDQRRSHGISGFPRGLQQRNYCGPNTLANLLRFHGLNVTQERIAAQIFTNGTQWTDLVGYLRNIPAGRTYAFLSNLEQVKDILDRDLPLIVGEYSGVDGHFIALIGYDDGMGVMIAQDPVYYEPVHITYREFEEAWKFADNLAVLFVPEASAKKTEGLVFGGAKAVDRWLEAMGRFAEGRFDEALAEFDALIAEQPAYLSPLRSAIQIDMLTGAFDRAGERIETVLERDPRCYWALRYAGDIAIQAGDHELAMECYSRAVRVYPDDPTLHYARGEIALAQGNRKRGRTELMRAVEELPSATAPRLRLAREYLETGDKWHALHHAMGVVEVDGSHADAQLIVKAAEKLA